MSETISINLDMLDVYKTDFIGEATNFLNSVYSSYKTSINAGEYPKLQRLYNQLQSLVDQLKATYDGTTEWWNKYNNSVKELENCLSHSGYTLENADVTSYIKSSLPELKNYKSTTENTFTVPHSFNLDLLKGSAKEVSTKQNGVPSAVSALKSQIEEHNKTAIVKSETSTSLSCIFMTAILKAQDTKVDTVYNASKQNLVNQEKKYQESLAKIEEIKAKSLDLTKYSGEVASKAKASPEVKESNGKITTNNQRYSIVPDSEYTGAPGTIPESHYRLLIAQVCGESGNSPDDMLAVTSTVLNRMETGGYFGDNVQEVFEIGYFPWGESYRNYVEGGQYYNTEWGQEKIEVATQVVNDALNGVRNVESDVYYYCAATDENGNPLWHNKFSDVL